MEPDNIPSDSQPADDLTPDDITPADGLEDADDSQPTDAPELTWKERKETAMHFYEEGKAAFNDRDYATALERFQHSAEILPKGRTLQYMAVICEKQRRPNDALPLLAQAHELSPTHDLIAHHYAIALSRDKQKAEAIKVLQEVLARNPKYGPAERLLTDLRRNK